MYVRIFLKTSAGERPVMSQEGLWGSGVFGLGVLGFGVFFCWGVRVEVWGPKLLKLDFDGSFFR